MKVSFIVDASGVYAISVGDDYAMSTLVTSVETAAADLRSAAAEDRENAARLITRAMRKEAAAAATQ